MSYLVSFPAWDTQLFLDLNSSHTAWLDPIMLALSSSVFWIPLYLLIMVMMIRQKQWIGGGLVIGCMLLAFGVVDQLSVHLFKNVFERLRPCHEPSIQHLVRSLEDCGGQYGFVSNHASNSFCLALFVSLFFKNRYVTIGLFTWASLVAYSRIYVGKHYPLDLLCGAVFGLLIAWLIFELYKKLVPSPLLASLLARFAR